uniref:DUF4283 domain-containing protein n=1 Tax=Tanacetum cinerariifolium TaxID=118510 RepID=A0A699IN22_TANCI|nr:hypothetical protein [Tanacetum cinerariifolium]
MKTKTLSTHGEGSIYTPEHAAHDNASSHGFDEIVYSVSDILDFNPSLIRVVSDFFKVSLLTPVDIDKFIRDHDIDKLSEKPSDPIVQSVDINPTPTSYAGAAEASTIGQSKVNSNFCTLVVEPKFDDVNISIPRKVVEKEKHGLTRIMVNSKGFFFFKFKSQAGLKAVLDEGPWLICKSPIILKKWSMDTRLLKEELTRILIWVKLHVVPIQVFEEDGISLIASFIGKLVMLDSYTSIPSLTGEDFTKETIHVDYEWRPPRCDVCKIFGHVHDQCPKKVVSPSIVTTSTIITEGYVISINTQEMEE